MTDTAFGSGIEPVQMPTVESDVTPVPMPTVESPSEVPPVEMPSLQMPEGFNVMDLVDAIKAGMRHEMDAAVADIERRLAQAREIERANATGIPRETVHAEDINVNFHMIDGYTLTANSPAAGSIAWASLHVVLAGVDYTIADGNTANKYAWFIKPGTGTAVTMQTGNTMPVLGASDALIFVNNGGVPISVLESSITYAVGPGVVGNAQLDTSTQTLLSNLQASDTAIQSRLDGAITSHYQNDPPWPAGAVSPGGGDVNMGDIWYDANDGGAFRWTGATGTPANTWQRIADTSTAEIAAKVNTKTTTYLGTTAPVAPAGGFTSGDLWLDSANGNVVKRWDATLNAGAGGWTTLQLGDAAISGIGGAKVGTGISGTNITTGTVPGARIGTGVAPTVLTGAGTVPLAGIPSLTPAKLNTAFHMLY